MQEKKTAGAFLSRGSLRRGLAPSGALILSLIHSISTHRIVDTHGLTHLQAAVVSHDSCV